eukprot:4087095-Amphidinium_carterae.1
MIEHVFGKDCAKKQDLLVTLCASMLAPFGRVLPAGFFAQTTQLSRTRKPMLQHYSLLSPC